MRLALMMAAPLALMACQSEPDAAGPERRSAAGEVLGGEVTDDMLPLDTVRSNSPAGSSEPTGEPPRGTSQPPRAPDTGKVPPKPQLTAAPMPDMTMPAEPEPLRTGQE